MKTRFKNDKDNEVVVCWMLPGAAESSQEFTIRPADYRIPGRFPFHIPASRLYGFPPGTRGISVLGRYPRGMFEALTKYVFGGGPSELLFCIMDDRVETQPCLDLLEFLLGYWKGDRSYDLFKVAANKKVPWQKINEVLKVADWCFDVPVLDPILTSIYGKNIHGLSLVAAIDHAGKLSRDDPMRKHMISYLAGVLAETRTAPGSAGMAALFKKYPEVGGEVTKLMRDDV